MRATARNGVMLTNIQSSAGWTTALLHLIVRRPTDRALLGGPFRHPAIVGLVRLGLEVVDAGYRHDTWHGCHQTRLRALNRTSPHPLRTVTTAVKTAASSRVVANRVRNLPSIVTVPTCGSSQRRCRVSTLITASRHTTDCSAPEPVAKVTSASGRRLKPVNRKRFTVKR